MKGAVNLGFSFLGGIAGSAGFLVGLHLHDKFKAYKKSKKNKFPKAFIQDGKTFLYQQTQSKMLIH